LGNSLQIKKRLLINLETYHWALDCVSQNRDNLEGLQEHFGKIIGQNGFGSYFFQGPKNLVFSQLVAHVEGNRIVSFFLSGPSEWRFSKFETQFEPYNKHYSHYDNTWFSSFIDSANNVPLSITTEKEHWLPDDYVSFIRVGFLDS
jgi:hypothetical protein